MLATKALIGMWMRCDQSTKRRRITGKTTSIHATAAPAEVCDDGPRDVPENIHAQEMPELKNIHALQSAATASTDVSYDVSTDIVEMERAVGQLIRDAGNPAEKV